MIVGGGGREHAIAWKLKHDDQSVDLICAPGNPGIAALARCIPVPSGDVTALVDLAVQNRPDLVVVGPEAPLADGLVDRLAEVGIRSFGPSGNAARIESSKRFAKELMLRAKVPTALATWHSTVDSAKRAVRQLGAPVVIKASGLAAGKGVVVAGSIPEADAAIDAMLLSGWFGAAGSEILVEEFMSGEELSLFFLADGANYLPMLPAQDHKRLGEHDTGPNTGGMGAFAPVSLADDRLVAEVGESIIRPTLEAMKDLGAPFHGLLYAGLMITEEGPRVVEFNCRFGDPETEVVLPLMTSTLVELLVASTYPGGLAATSAPSFSSGAAVTTVISSAGYPDAPQVGKAIVMPEHAPSDALVFHAGTRLSSDGTLVTAGGRVFAVTGVGRSMAEAREVSALVAGSITFEGAYFRRDIGWRELTRHAGAS